MADRSNSYGVIEIFADGGSASLFQPEDFVMLDVVFLVAGSIFFLLTAAYAEGCDRL